MEEEEEDAMVTPVAAEDVAAAWGSKLGSGTPIVAVAAAVVDKQLRSWLRH